MNSTVPQANANTSAPLGGSTEPHSAAHLAPIRLVIFVGIILSLTLGATWLVVTTWNSLVGVGSYPLWQLIFPTLTIGFVATTILSMRFMNPLLQLCYRICAVWLGVLSHLFCAAVFAWILHLFFGLLDLPGQPALIAKFLFATALVVSAYGLLNAAVIRVTSVTVRLSNLPPAWEGQTTALVTDLHLGNVRGAGFVRRVVRRLNQLQPEAVFLSGDMFDGTLVDYSEVTAPWRELQTRHGAFFVTGNHEEFRNRNGYLSALEKHGIRVLNNELVQIDDLQVVGVHDGEAGDPQGYRKILQRVGLNGTRPSILLAHQPGHLKIAAEVGVSLQLSGHTHGGQVWPWTLVGKLVHGRFNHGLHRFGSLQVLTSSGVGTWGPPMRLGTKSEIVLVTLEGSPVC